MRDSVPQTQRRTTETDAFYSQLLDSSPSGPLGGLLVEGAGQDAAGRGGGGEEGPGGGELAST